MTKFLTAVFGAFLALVLQLASPATAAGWTEWYSMGGSIRGEPSIVSYGKGKLALLARGDDDALWYSWVWGENASIQGGWVSLGGIITSGPSCTSRTNGIIDCYARSSASSAAKRSYNGKSWNAWEDLGGVFDSNAAGFGSFESSTGVVVITSKSLFLRQWNS